MKRLIRKSVFETNSSSSHSISMSSEDKQFLLDTIYPDQFGRVYVRGGEYGWEWERYNDAETKLSYAFQDDVPLELLEKVVKDQTGATEVIFDEKSKADGYIDHSSVGTAHSVCVDEESTKNFIFNKNSWLFTGNDNSNPGPTFYHVPIYKDGRMIQPIFKYELKIEKFPKTTKFIEKPDNEELEEGIESLMRGAIMSDNGDFIINDDIYFQISRNRNFFELSYTAHQDLSKGYIVMTREGGAVYELENELKEDGKFEGLNWEEQSKVLTEELLKDEKLAKKVKFTLTKIS